MRTVLFNQMCGGSSGRSSTGKEMTEVVDIYDGQKHTEWDGWQAMMQGKVKVSQAGT